MIRRSLVALFAVGFICFALAVGIAHGSGAAQTDTGSGLIVDPNELSITVADGCSRALSFSPPQGCHQEHRLLLQATQEISGVVVISNDLRRTDDAAILPASTITVSSTKSMEAGSFGMIDVRIDLSQVPAGEYHGAIILAHSAGSTRIPITLRTRDHWLIPLLVLLGSLAVGGGLSLYREVRKRPDELREQLAQLKLQVDSDSGLLAEFRDALTQRIEAAHQALERNKLADAETQIGEAEQCLRRWQQARSDWIKLGGRIDSEQKNVEMLVPQLAGETNTYRDSLLARIQELRQSLPKTETPQDANVALKAISDASTWQRQVADDLTGRERCPEGDQRCLYLAASGCRRPDGGRDEPEEARRAGRFEQNHPCRHYPGAGCPAQRRRQPGSRSAPDAGRRGAGTRRRPGPAREPLAAPGPAQLWG
jgi:hypothetical protein